MFIVFEIRIRPESLHLVGYFDFNQVPSVDGKQVKALLSCVLSCYKVSCFVQDIPTSVVAVCSCSVNTAARTHGHFNYGANRC